MRHDRTDEDLQQQDCRDDEKILADPPLARSEGPELRQYRFIGALSGSFRNR
jgi:hypothetical protein